VGLPTRYDSYKDLDGDKKAVKEMTRILKDNGKILITLPFGRRDVFPEHRIYDSGSIDELFSGLKVVKKNLSRNSVIIGCQLHSMM